MPGFHQQDSQSISKPNTSEMCHGKTELKVFVVVIPKEGLTGRAPSIFLLLWHQLQNIIYEGSNVKFYSRRHTQRRIGGALPAHPSLGMTTTKILRHVFPWHISSNTSVCLFYDSTQMQKKQAHFIYMNVVAKKSAINYNLEINFMYVWWMIF